jgi:hypothetical protein
MATDVTRYFILKMIIFWDVWDVAPCSLVEIDRRFRYGTVASSCEYGDEPAGSGTTELVQTCLPAIFSFVLEGVGTSETSVNCCESTGRNIPDDSHLQTRCLENM